MKLLFSEYKSDYTHYIFPYAIWAIPESDETPGMIFDRGFLPASREFERFYMCRQVRVKLSDFEPSSENRRIFRKCEGIGFKLMPRSEFEYNSEWREFCKHYADIKFGKDVMTYERLDALFAASIISHVLIYTDKKTHRDIGMATLYLEEKTMAYYYYSFYDLNYYERNLGMFMMTSAVDYFAQQKYDYMYLGSCYSRNALYKTQFSGAEFFNGFHWADNLQELKYLIKRDKGPVTQHLLETDEYGEQFYAGSLKTIAETTDFTLNLE